MRKPNATQIRVAAFLADVATECSRDPLDTAEAYLTRVSQEFNVPLDALMRAVASEPAAISATDARKLSRAIAS